MKVCVYLRCPIETHLHSGNLRSEPRCERLVLEALSKCDWVTDLYTTGCLWVNGKQFTSKYRGSIAREQQADTVLIMQDWGWLPAEHNYKAYIVGIFAAPHSSHKQGLDRLSVLYGKRFVFTCGSPSLFRNEKYKDSLKTFSQPLYLLPEPRIVGSKYIDCFNNKTILFPRRLIFINMVTGSPYMRWALRKLREDSSLNIRVLTGCLENEVNDIGINGSYRVLTEINRYFWENENTKPYYDLRARVKIEYGLGWDSVLSIYATSKLLADAFVYWGGPPLEASMHGVPFVGTSKEEGALCDCAEYLVGRNEEEVCSILDRLLVDKDFYKKIAKAYHDYAVSTYSFKAYGDNLFNIIEKMDIH